MSWKNLSNQVNLAYSVKLNMKQLITDPFPFNHTSFQVSALKNPFFTVSMETNKSFTIPRWSKNLWVNMIQILMGPGFRSLTLQGKIGPQSPHFQISMATVPNFKIPTPLRCSLTPTDCPCPISLRLVDKRQSS